MSKIFIDTGAWIACIDKNDKHHKAASDYLETIQRNNIQVVTSNYIFDETITWVKFKLGHKETIKIMNLWEQAKNNDLLTVYWIDEKITETAWNIFKKYNDHNLSFTDCTSFAVCRKYDIKKIFGFDSDFNTLGFLLSPYQIHEKKINYKVLEP